MATIPLKPQYGPTLGTLLAPRWSSAPRVFRGSVYALGGALVAIAVVAVLTLLPARFSYGGATPFHFSYRGLYRTRTQPGEIVRIDRRAAGGRLEDSFAVSALRLPPYEGGLSGELPLYASGYIDGLSRKFNGFALRGEGKTRVNTVPAYNIFYEAKVEGREMLGRDVLLLPERSGAREGVAIEMLSVPSKQVKSPQEVAGSGVLEKPAETFTFD
jgi:hypothetical protein